MYQKVILYQVLIIFLLGCQGTPQSLSKQDFEEIKALKTTYNQGWLDKNKEQVLSVFTDDAVLIPHHGDPQISGLTNMEAFWFPPNTPPTNVILFTSEILHIEGHDQYAWMSGRQKLSFKYNGSTYINEGNFVAVAIKQRDQWKLQALSWNDPPFEIN